ncbi:acyltransferase [Paraburkholderia sp. IMGN_8]|uniref:acyltransferase family protein n=1 Tax=Paraburkholderia sp. IMGN_8 TaxID=3136564 RepID=UPI0031015A35
MIGYSPALISITLLTTTFGIFQLWQARPNAAPASSPLARNAEINGLRAFLAINVAVSHLLRTHRAIETGEWEGVIGYFESFPLFFMITGFIFWEKVLKTGTKTDWLKLYISRLFRIAPMYLFVVGIMLFVVFARTGFTLHESASSVAYQVLCWLGLGIVDVPHTVNGHPRADLILAGVTWTLRWEWFFYASLPVLALLSGKKTRVLFPLLSLAACLLVTALTSHKTVPMFASLYLVGMSAASLHHTGHRLHLGDRVTSPAALFLLAVMFAAPHAFEALSPISVAFYALFFYLICSGSTLFGLLTSRAARMLGQVSYSIYLAQGLFLTLLFSIPAVRSFAFAGVPAFWLVGLAYLVLLCASASFSYRYIEAPCISLGRTLHLSAPTGMPASAGD